MGSPREEVRAPATAVVLGGGSLRAGIDEVDGVTAVVATFVTADSLLVVCLVAPFATTPGAAILCLLPAAGAFVDGAARGLLNGTDSLDRAGACSCFSC